MTKLLKRAAASRLRGDRPSVPVALASAMAVGIAAAVVTYKALRG